MVRTLVAALALGAAATLTGAAPAHASANACLDSIDGPNFHDSYGQTVLYPSRLYVLTDSYVSGSACKGARASVGISRPDGGDFRNVNASFFDDGEINHLVSVHPMTWTTSGPWVIRQVAVHKNGVLVVKRYGADADRTIVRRGSVLSGRPTGRLAPAPGSRYLWISGTLKAYSSYGTLVPLKAGQPIEVYASRAGVTRRIAREDSSTHASGYYLVPVDIGSLHGYAIRVVYPSPYQTIARSSVHLGITR
jgi:hypothetical protein